MELELRKHRRVLMGETLELILRRGDLGASAVGPRCERCGREMVFKGYPDKEVRGLEGEAAIPRAYYVCPACGAGIFPPRPASETETGLLE
jgi:DNA-directed RNA polymerase subunit RPC12/RpoP